jgi:hypothetical protein
VIALSANGSRVIIGAPLIYSAANGSASGEVRIYRLP